MLLIILTTSWASEAPPKVVTVISWWNYLDRAWVKDAVYKECNTSLAIQSYKDANEFRKSFELKYYDIAIYESSQFKEVENEIPQKLLINSKPPEYPLPIKNIYNRFINKVNTNFFIISNTVFLYNPSNINLTSNDTIKSIQDKLVNSKQNLPLIILDDPVIINAMVQQETLKKMTTKEFSNLFKYDNLIISNDFNDYKGLGVFFTWSGEAIYHKMLAKKQGVELEIATIPRYSYITADLISLVSKNPDAACVAKLFSSKRFLHRLQIDTFYYSPYLDYKDITNLSHKKLYETFNNVLTLNIDKWLLPSKKDLNQAITSWEKVVFDYGL